MCIQCGIGMYPMLHNPILNGETNDNQTWQWTLSSSCTGDFPAQKVSFWSIRTRVDRYKLGPTSHICCFRRFSRHRSTRNPTRPSARHH